MDFISSLLLAVLAYTLLSTGYVLQKKGIGWMGSPRKRGRIFFRDLFTWTAGFLLMNLYIVPSAAALRYLEPHIVASLAGWGVIVLVGLSGMLLKESIHVSDMFFTLLIVLSIALLNILESGDIHTTVQPIPLAAALALPFLLLIPAFLRALPRPSRALFFACISGLSAGLIVVTMKILVSNHGYQIGKYFVSPYLYTYLLFSLTAFVTLQISYRWGSMMAVGPVQYSTAILYPALCSRTIFSNRLHIGQWVALALIILGVVGILRRHPQSEKKGD